MPDFQALVAGRPSLPGGPRYREALVAGRCREALVAGRPSLPGGPRCREAFVVGKPSLPGGPRCREALVAGRPSLPGGPRCRRPSPFSGGHILEKGPPQDQPRMCSRCREVNLSLKGRTTFQDVAATKNHMARCGPHKTSRAVQGPDPRL